MALSPIGDTVALTTLAYTLYSRVIVVARDAPVQFEELLQDLDVHKSILYRIKSQVDHANGSDYGVAVQNILSQCFRTLYRLRDLTAKYENLGEYDFQPSRTPWFADDSKPGVTGEFSSSASPGPKTRRRSRDFERRSEANSSSFSLSYRRKAGEYRLFY